MGPVNVRRPSPAMVVAMIALFISLAGVASGGRNAPSIPANSIGPKQLKPNSVGSSEIQTNAVKVPELASNIINAGHLKPNSVGNSELITGAINPSKFNPDTFPKTALTTTANVPVPNGDYSPPLPLPFNSEFFDTGDMHSNTTNPARVRAPVAGVYRITATIDWLGSSFATFWRNAGIYKNGTDWLADSLDSEAQHSLPPSSPGQMNLEATARLDANDFITVLVYSECDCGATFDYAIKQSAGTSNPPANPTPTLTMIYLGP